jgi:hypothetical protein
LFSLGQVLGIGVELFIAALNEQDVKSSARDLHRNYDTCRACAYHSEIGRQYCIAA